ncbi:hypothetical protein [Streptomyces sp. NPDC014733]|uniref:hypothetical protein n=1 Tax=Streptomyces sp. NPDC014733 TaxID=3364885 RepID=UPI0036F4F1F0
MRAQDPAKSPDRDAARARPRPATPRTPATDRAGTLRALQRSIGNAAVARLLETGRPAHGPGTGTGHQDPPPVQRRLSYPSGGWAERYIRDGAFMDLVREADPGGRGRDVVAPFADLVQQVQQAGRQVNFVERAPRIGRAMFDVDAGTKEGVLYLDVPPPTAGAAELRAFATTLAHELQHALDYVNKRFPTDRSVAYSDDSTVQQGSVKITAELRAFGVEAAAAAKLALGDHYEVSEKPFSSLVSGLGASSISPEQQMLVQEFQQIASHERAGDPLEPLRRTADSKILDRLSAYLQQYALMSESGQKPALAWLERNPKAVEHGLVAGARLFVNRRTQLRK